MVRTVGVGRKCFLCASIAVLGIFFSLEGQLLAQASHSVPQKVPPKRTSQIQDGFGINSDLPRDPYLPWNRWWWTRMFDAGFKWIRIGQYENSSDYTSWDWIERKRGVYAASPELEDAVDSLVDNGMDIQVQLLYGNQMYTARSGKLPDVSDPEPGTFHNDDRGMYSVFWPPVTPEQTAAFNKYVAWMVDHFKDRIHYWALWNEQDIGYWNPWGNPEQYGQLLTSFVETVHKTNAQAKVIYGGQADPSRDFTQRALDTCKCASGIDVYAYHTYPGYGQNMNPETMDYGAYLNESPRALRDLVTHYPGMKSGIPFFDDEFNSIPSWVGSDEMVQAKYVPRGMIYNHAAGVKTFVWLLAAGTDGNEYDDFGFIHGLTNHDYDFTPRPVFYALQNTNALFADTKLDPSIEISGVDVPALRRKSGFPFLSYGFRSKKGKAIVAYWLAAHSLPGKDSFPAFYSTLTLKGTGIRNPVLIDVVSGDIRPLQWKKDTSDTLETVPVTDSIMAIADADYFDWPVLPEAPSSVSASASGGSVKLTWQVHGGDPQHVVVERRDDVAATRAAWHRVAELPASATDYTDSHLKKSQQVAYRLRATNSAGESATSNTVRIVAP